MALTTEQKTELNRIGSPVALIPFLRLAHPGLQDDVRLVGDVLDYVRDGETWTACQFGYRLLTDGTGAPRTVLTVPNVDRRIGLAVREATRRATCTLQILASDDFDLTADPRTELNTPAVIYQMLNFEVVDVDVDLARVEATVMLRDYSQEPWPVVQATQDRFPGLFR
jgi:hypothetical protein